MFCKTQMPESTVYTQAKTTNYLHFHVQNFEKLHVNSSVDLKKTATSVNPSNFSYHAGKKHLHACTHG